MDTVGSILWTAMPVELVVEGALPPVTETREMVVRGRLLQVLPGADGTFTVQRLISSDPQDFLDPRWQPGALVSMTPEP